MLYMALNSDSQEKCRKELDEVCGKQNISLEDEANLIYLRVNTFYIFGPQFLCFFPFNLKAAF